MRRLVGSLGLIMAGLLALASPATAHGVVPGVEVIVDRVTPPIQGLIVSVRPFLTEEITINDSASIPIDVLAPTGEPFLRFGLEGVQGNLSSPTWYRSNSALHTAPVPAAALPSKAPQWVTVSRTPTWSWYDPRIHDLSTPADLVHKKPGSSYGFWAVLLREGDQMIEVSGHHVYEPRHGTLKAVILTPAQGLSVQGLAGGTVGLLAQATTTDPITVMGAGGEPFARTITGGWEVNEASPVGRVDADVHDVPVTGLVGSDVTPRWRALGQGPSLVWNDPRVQAPFTNPPAAVARSRTPVQVASWNVPIDVGGRQEMLSGVTQWIPSAIPARSSNTGPILVVSLIVVLVGVGAFLLRWRLR